MVLETVDREYKVLTILMLRDARKIESRVINVNLNCKDFENFILIFQKLVKSNINFITKILNFKNLFAIYVKKTDDTNLILHSDQGWQYQMYDYQEIYILDFVI